MAKDGSCHRHDSCLYRGRCPRGRRVVRTRTSRLSLEFTGCVRVLLAGDALRQPVARPRVALLGSRGGRPHLRLLRGAAATDASARAPAPRGGGMPVHGRPGQSPPPHGITTGESVYFRTAGPLARRWSKRLGPAHVDRAWRDSTVALQPLLAPAASAHPVRAVASARTWCSPWSLDVCSASTERLGRRAGRPVASD